MTCRHRISGLIAVGMLAFSAAGCYDGEGDALTPEEAAALAELIGRASLGPVDAQLVGSVPPGATAARSGGAKEYDFDKECSKGGSVNLSGTATFDSGEDAVRIEIDGAVRFDHCAETTDDGVTYALTGGVDHLLEVVGSFSGDVVRVEVEGSASGSVGWENLDDGSSGVCEVDVTIDVAVEVDKGAGTWEVEGGLTGTVCGISVEADAEEWLKKGWKGY
ncbi:MAG: hypothetical protein OXQ94_18970 [Gemmatimonadota bacterium]|nr:hypothetical protein [Gemmatimonadota bacterium]MDE2873754.1 hypothetical protein [Gemmatimonadota bacterium]